MFPPGFKITSEMLWSGTLLFAAIDAIFIPLLAWRIKSATFRRFKPILGVTTAIFWCTLWIWILSEFWDSVYRYVFPSWTHWLIPPIYGLLFAGMSLLFWWLALNFRGNAIVNFCLLGGLWGMVTHLIAVYMGIVDKPPVLQGVAPEAAVIVAIFEFMFYWCIILSVAALLHHSWQKFRSASA